MLLEFLRIRLLNYANMSNMKMKNICWCDRHRSANSIEIITLLFLKCQVDSTAYEPVRHFVFANLGK